MRAKVACIRCKGECRCRRAKPKRPVDHDLETYRELMRAQEYFERTLWRKKTS